MTTVPDATRGSIELADLVQLEQPGFYTDDPYPLYARLRRESPVHYYAPLDLWLITRYEDVRHVGKNPLTFSSSDGILLNDFRYGNIVASFFPPDAENFSLDAPPRHNALRRAIRSPFSAINVAKINEQVRAVVAQMLDGLDTSGEVDWLHDVAMAIPSVVVATLLGMPLVDRPLLDRWSTEMLKMGAATGKDELAAAAAGMADMYGYFAEQLAERRRRPGGGDLLTALAAAEDSGELSTSTVHMMIGGVMAAGNETTRNLVSGTAIALAEHSDQYDRLVADPGLARPATDELLRWITPVRGFGRTVTEDTEVAGQRMTAGQRVFMLYPAANRDETVFDAPETFDIARDFSQNMHLSFGYGQHSCIGSALARLETVSLLQEMASRFRSITIVGTPERDPQLLGHAYRSLHITVEPI